MQNALSTTQPWLDRYGTHYHAWKEGRDGLQRIFCRPLGVVEQLFDVDGTDYEGRADITSWLQLDLRSDLTDNEDLRQRLTETWALLRAHHPILYATAEDVSQGAKEQRCFVVKPPPTLGHALQAAKSSIAFVEDCHPLAEPQTFYHHLMNVGRVVRTAKGLSRLFVLPTRSSIEGTIKLSIMLVTAHCISDGLSVHNWLSHFLELLNTPPHERERNPSRTSLGHALAPSVVRSRLPPAQEDLYPTPPKHSGSTTGTLARYRCFLAITLILRHVRRPAPAAFLNPLRREAPLSLPPSLPPLYSTLLDYSSKSLPPLATISSRPSLSPTATARLRSLCKRASVSVGAGGFALVALTMMRMQELKDPNNTLPFVCSFPVNPRPFLRSTANSPTTSPESLMLAFSDGIVFPFLPSHLPLEKSFIFLAKKAHKQLVTFQKNRTTTPAEIKSLGARSPAQLLPQLYLMMLERLEARLPEHKRSGYDLQGAYPPKASMGMATCGVSSMGPRWQWFERGQYDLDDKSRDLVADFRGLVSTGRVRDGEFLIGSSSDRETMGFGVGGDGNAMDPVKVKQWEKLMETLLEDDVGGEVDIGAATKSRL